MSSPSIEIRPTSLAEVCIIATRVFRDDRGYLLEAFNEAAFAEAGIPTRFVQDNLTRSVKGALRGLHYQFHRPQGKLVRVVRGRIYDVAVDVRRTSPTFGKWAGFVLSDVEMNGVWIPPGFAHGFCVLSDVADVLYKATDFYAANDERGVIWNDPMLSIDWPVTDPIISAKDSQFPQLRGQRDLPD